jgi:hypothetical protein
LNAARFGDNPFVLSAAKIQIMVDRKERRCMLLALVSVVGLYWQRGELKS